MASGGVPLKVIFRSGTAKALPLPNCEFFRSL
jgi:hypothetical protein